MVQFDESALPAFTNGGVLEATRAYTIVHWCAFGYPFG